MPPWPNPSEMQSKSEANHQQQHYGSNTTAATARQQLRRQNSWCTLAQATV